MESTIFIEVNQSTKQVRVVDQTDYALQGLSGGNLTTLDAKGLGTLRFNGAILAQKLTIVDPLVNLAAGSTTSLWFDCILDNDGNIAYGTYSIDDYSFRAALNDQLVNAVIVSSEGDDGGFRLDNIGLAGLFSEGDTFVISDSLSLNSGTKTVVSATFADGDTTFIVEGAINFELVPSSKISFDVTRASGSASGVYQKCPEITPTYSFTSDCDRGMFGYLSVIDTTNIGTQTLVSKELTLKYPSWKDLPSVETDEGAIVLQSLSTGSYTVINTYTLQYTLGGLITSYVSTVMEEEKVTCKGSLCGLLPCIQNLLNVHVAAVKTGFSKYQVYVDSIALHYIQAMEYKKCGEYDRYSDQLVAIDALLDASGCECSCCDNDELYDIVNVSPEEANVITEIMADITALQNVTTAQAAQILSLQTQLALTDQALLLTQLQLDDVALLPPFAMGGTLSQNSTSAPVATIGINSLANDVTMARVSAGQYTLTLDNPVDEEKMFFSVQVSPITKGVRWLIESSTVIRIWTYDIATFAMEDDILLDSKFLIQAFQY